MRVRTEVRSCIPSAPLEVDEPLAHIHHPVFLWSVCKWRAKRSGVEVQVEGEGGRSKYEDRKRRAAAYGLSRLQYTLCFFFSFFVFFILLYA
jgi:hypothetical protein